MSPSIKTNPIIDPSKPYNQCITCPHIGVICDGPNFLAMTPERWCEWCKLRKDHLGFTNSHIADTSGISKVSVDRVMSGSAGDLRMSTMQAITRILINGTWGQYPCAMAAADASETEAAAVARCAQLEARLQDQRSAEERKIAHLKDQIEFTRSEIKQKNKEIEYLMSLLTPRQPTI